MPEFTSKQDIFDYLESNSKALMEANNGDATPYLIPIFASEITDNPTIMMDIYKWLDVATDINFGYVIRENQDMLRDVNLSLYKFKILCEYRGPLELERFLDDTVRLNPHNEYIVQAAKHKDFPHEGKNIMFNIHNNTDYLSTEAREMFVF